MLNRLLFALAATTLLGLASCALKRDAGPELGKLQKLGDVHERYSSYNVEMVEVTGGRFWAPYDGPPDEVYRERPPIDLNDPKLRHLARHLGPAFMRVSGTWANNTYLEAPGERLTAPPAGYKQILTRQQWQSVVAFAKAVDALLVTSFAVSGGTRGPDSVWTTEQAQRLADLTREAGGSIYAAEFFNEPNVPGATMGMPEGYDAARYGEEFRIFRAWARTTLPALLILGPGSIGEDSLLRNPAASVVARNMVRSEDMLKANPDGVDALSYHFYGSVSQRCTAFKIGTAQKQEALQPSWLDRTIASYEYYAALRDQYARGKPIWNTETAQAACGGSPWASTFLDSFRFLNQLGALAQRGVQVVMHNTLAASDYALIDQDSLNPRPNYWAAVLWRRIMGQTVLRAPVVGMASGVRLYAHCLRDTAGGVGLLALNTSEVAHTLVLGVENGKVWVMTGAPLDTRAVQINGQTPRLDDSGELRGLDGVPLRDGRVSLPAQSIAFVAAAAARNSACR